MLQRRRHRLESARRSWVALIVVALALLLAPIGHAQAHSHGGSHGLPAPGEHNGHQHDGHEHRGYPASQDDPIKAAHACVISVCTPAVSLSAAAVLMVPLEIKVCHRLPGVTVLAGVSSRPDVPPPRSLPA